MKDLIITAQKYKERTAIISYGNSYSYDQLLLRSEMLASSLLSEEEDLGEARIAFMVDPSFEYTVMQWGIWRAGGIAVPLCVLHPLESIKYVLEDSQVNRLVVTEKYFELLKDLSEELSIEVIVYDRLQNQTAINLPAVDESRRAMILYTSGTTSKPKGVVTTHKNISFQIKTLVEAWQWEKEDHILNILPLHHVHGIINVMSCALASGAICEFLPKFEAEKVWQKFEEGKLTLFMAVPTIYYKLVKHWEAQSEDLQQAMSKACNRFRLMVSGSAALPIPVLNQWESITGQRLLERYGMTEIGMALSNPYDKERRPGHVGQALPGVSIRLADEKDQEVAEGEQGEIQIKGPNVFLEYWNKPEPTQRAFTSDGWFKSGDIALLNDNYYQILGRNSVDIIKSGGYKISALEIESVLLRHEQIEQAGVVGVPSEEWGETVAVAIVGDNNNADQIKQWLKDKLPTYKIPRDYIFIEDLPKNTLGKVTKNKLKEYFA